jgi:cytochrome c peroxidase
MKYYLYILILFVCASCRKHENTTPYIFPDIVGFRKVPQNQNNPVTVEGVALGKRLFFDSILSKDFTLSCASCHLPSHGFADDSRFSMGVDGAIGSRNAMTLVNLAWYEAFFWDGRSKTLQEQALIPVPKEDEMHLPWDIAVQRIKQDNSYLHLFAKAFNTTNVTKELVAKALEQFQTTLISYNSPYDKFTRFESNLNESATRGLQIFNSEKGDCFHCHQTNELFVRPQNIFSNNGIDVALTPNDFIDKGLGAITGNPLENGKFKIPTLRNLAFTAPYMHDGRFQTLEEVIDMYNAGPKSSPSLDTIMITEANKRLERTGIYGLNLSAQDKEDLKNFLLSLSDSTFLRTHAR